MKITFFTTSTFSDTQSMCIRKLFPESNHVKFDGRRGWFMVWYDWLNFAKDFQSDWYVHLDEDCFICFGEEFQTTNLLNGTIIHMWHQRERWSDSIVSTLHKIPNRIRFDSAIEKIKSLI